MRTAFIRQLIEEARSNPKIFLVVGDLGYSVVEPFAREFSDRFLNAGVAEQNMTGVAAGLASEGFHVFTYSIANFPTLRCFEQIRNDVCYHRLPVTIVAVGSGLAYGNLGYSHHGVQDIAVMRALPGLRLLSPADPGEAIACVRYVSQNPGPTYLRLGKAGEQTLHDKHFAERSPIQVRPGDGRLALASTGTALTLALSAAERLDQEFGLRPAVFSLPWLKPLTGTDVSALEGYAGVVTIEEHVGAGGFGELLRSLLLSPKVSTLAIPDEMMETVGSQAFLRERAGLNVEAVVRESCRLAAQC